MPKRDEKFWLLYRTVTMPTVMARADNRCEVMVDSTGSALSTKKGARRCGKFLPPETVTYTNFLHVATRNGASQEWVLNPENVTLGCADHHYEEARTGKHVTRCDYSGDITYVPED